MQTTGSPNNGLRNARKKPLQMWEKNLQGLKSWAWLPKFCRTFGVLCEGSSTPGLLAWTRFCRTLLQKNPRVREILVRDSGARNGCTNFMDTWKNAFFLQEQPMPIKFLLLGGEGGFGGGAVPILFFWAHGQGSAEPSCRTPTVLQHSREGRARTRLLRTGFVAPKTTWGGQLLYTPPTPENAFLGVGDV